MVFYEKHSRHAVTMRHAQLTLPHFRQPITSRALEVFLSAA
jgi:hypothetical protein